MRQKEYGSMGVWEYRREKRVDLWIAAENSDAEIGQSYRSREVVQDANGGGKSFLHVEARLRVHGRVNIHQHCTG